MSPAPMSLLVLIATLSVSHVFAQEKCPPASWVQVVELSRQAKTLLDAGKHDEALVALRTAYGICPEPILQRSMGRVHEEAGNLEESLSSFQACAADALEEALRSECEQRAKSLAAKLSTATLFVETEVAGAVLQLDDSPPRPCGQPVDISPGRHRIEVRADGRLPYLAELDIRGGRETRIPVALELVPAVPSPLTALTQPDEVRRPGGDTLGPGVDSGTETLSAELSGGSATWNWLGLGASVVALGVGVGFGAQYAIDKSNAQGERWDPELQGWWAADEVGSRNLILGASLAAVGVVGGLASLLLWPDSPIEAGAAPTGGGAVVSITVGLP